MRLDNPDENLNCLGTYDINQKVYRRNSKNYYVIYVKCTKHITILVLTSDRSYGESQSGKNHHRNNDTRFFRVRKTMKRVCQVYQKFRGFPPHPISRCHDVIHTKPLCYLQNILWVFHQSLNKFWKSITITAQRGDDLCC